MGWCSAGILPVVPTGPEPAPSFALGGCGRDARTTAGGTPALL